MTTIPRPRDGATVISVAVEGVPLTWIGPPLGAPEKGELAGDGSSISKTLIKNAYDLWDDPIQADHPSWKHAFNTTDEDPEGVLATLLHLGAGRAIILEAPRDVISEVFLDDDEASIGDAEGEEGETEK